jgi:aminocarboxymuconate-semialdehyde decarboxylase
MSGIDLHTHLAPRMAPAEVALDGLATGEDGRLQLDGKPLGPPRLYRPELLEAYRAELGLDEVVVSVPPPFFRQDLPAAEAAVWVAAINDGLADAVAGLPHASPLAYLPLEHPEAALAEYERVRDQDAWVGVVASAGGASVSLADPALRPLWSALDRDGRMLLLHPGSSPDARLDAFYLSNLLGNPAETTLAAAQLVFGDVLATHPRMRVLLVHCGGCVPSVVGRWERGVDTDRPGLEPLTESPRVAVRRLYADCLAHDPAVVDLAAATFGDERMVLGSDWPFPMGIEDPRTLVAHRDAAFRDAVGTANARAALGREA